MASGHESNSYDDSDNTYCRNNLDDPSSPKEKRLSDISGSKSGSLPLLHPHHGKERTLCQNLHSSSNQPLGTESSLFLDFQPQSVHQPQEISNTLESSNPQYHQTSENKSNMFRDTLIILLPEIGSSGNDGAYLLSRKLSETESRKSQNILQLSEKEPSETDDSHRLAIQGSHTVPSVNRQLLAQRNEFTDNKCHTIQEIQTRSKELSVNQDLGPSQEKLVEIDMNSIQGLNSVTLQQSGAKQLKSQDSSAVFHQSHQSSSAVSPTECSVSRDGFGNEFRDSPDANIACYFQYNGGTSEIQNSPLKLLQQSECETNYLQCSKPQELQQSESDPNMIKRSSETDSIIADMYSEMTLVLREPIMTQDVYFRQTSKSDPNVMKTSSKIDSIIDEPYSPTAIVLKETIEKQDAFSLCQQPLKSRTTEIQGIHQGSENTNLNKTTERHLTHSPYSVTQHQSKKRSRVVQHARRKSSVSEASNPLLDGFLEMCIVNEQIWSSDKSHVPIFWSDHYVLSLLQQPHADESKIKNVLVCGPLNWTSRLIKTFSRGLPVKYESPCSLVLQRNVTRCANMSLVSVWQVGDLNNSIKFLKSLSVSSRTTIMCVFTEIEQSILQMIELLQREISYSVPVVLVGCKNKHIPRKTILEVTKMGFLLKAKCDLSAFLVCHVNSIQEVDTVFFTAIDVSYLHTI